MIEDTAGGGVGSLWVRARSGELHDIDPLSNPSPEHVIRKRTVAMAEESHEGAAVPSWR